MAFRISRGTAIKQLMEVYGFAEYRAKRVCDIAHEFGRKAEPCKGGFVHVVYRGWSKYWPYTELFTIYDHTSRDELPSKYSYSKATTMRRRNSSAKGREGVARADVSGYNQRTKSDNSPKKGKLMPPRGRSAKAAEPEPEEAEAAAPDFSRHLTKDLSPTMSDYGDWFHENVTDIDELGKSDPGRLLALGSTLYPHFQRSELNQSRREARKTERNGAEEPEPEPAKPATRGRAATKAAAPAEAAPKPAPPRGRGKAAAATPAPY